MGWAKVCKVLLIPLSDKPQIFNRVLMKLQAVFSTLICYFLYHVEIRSGTQFFWTIAVWHYNNAINRWRNFTDNDKSTKIEKVTEPRTDGSEEFLISSVNWNNDRMVVLLRTQWWKRRLIVEEKTGKEDGYLIKAIYHFPFSQTVSPYLTKLETSDS